MDVGLDSIVESRRWEESSKDDLGKPEESLALKWTELRDPEDPL